MSFAQRAGEYQRRVEYVLERWLPAPDCPPAPLHRAMRHAVLNGGKRLRPLLVYAVAECLQLDPAQADASAAAIELVHCYSLVHDDLPAMDDDRLRRGQPTVHVAFDEATAILAGDALQTLAFEGLAAHHRARAGDAVALLARACGSLGMAGGQALDLQFEGGQPDRDALETMFALKTGALIAAALRLPATLREDLAPEVDQTLAALGTALGIAFQIRDDLLEIEGTTEKIGKSVESDRGLDKSTWPARFGVEAARARLDELLTQSDELIQRVPGDTAALRWLARRLIRRQS